jgi:hypothetical protein
VERVVGSSLGCCQPMSLHSFSIHANHLRLFPQ